MPRRTPPAPLGLEPLRDIVLSGRDKGLPARAAGRTVAEFLATGPRLSEFWTPLVVLDDAAMSHNLALMQRWSGERGLELMPHGKTTMAPTLWQRQLDAGCTGITLATGGQVRAARSFGLADIMLANELVDARSLAWLAGELADPELRFVCWADSLAAVRAMEVGLRAAGAPRPVDVLVELGAPDGRTGARTLDEAADVAQALAASDVLRLAGIAGYEGNVGHGRSAAALAAVRTFLERQVELHRRVGELYDETGDLFVTAGGSAYFDVVADVFGAAREDAPHAERTRWVLRSGAYLVHDDGYYRTSSPLDEAGGLPSDDRLHPALHAIGRVLSRPEAGLALLDGGKRDLPFDEGLPIPRGVATDLGEPFAPLRGAGVARLNDQHTYLTLTEPAPSVVPGAVVRLGLSHPCTTFDKWAYLPVVADGDSDEVVDLVATFF